MPVLVTYKSEKDPIDNEHARKETFFHYKSIRKFSGATGPEHLK